MSQQIFRKKALEKVSSPEQLNDCIKVTGTGMWLVLWALILILAGVCVWGCLGRMDRTVALTAMAESGKIEVRVPASYMKALPETVFFTCEGTEYTGRVLQELPPDSSALPDFLLTCDTLLPDGVYEAQVTVESIRPFSLILN